MLGYHRVYDAPTDVWGLCVSPCRFQEQLERLQARGAVQCLEEAIRGAPAADPAIVVTIDDGYADTFAAAKPLLERYGVPATVFLPTAHIGRNSEPWWDALERLLLTPGRLPRVLRVTVGGGVREWVFHETAVYTAQDALRYRDWRAWLEPPTERHAAYQEMWALLGRARHESRELVLAQLFAAAGLEIVARESHRLLVEAEAAELAASELISVGCHTTTHALLAALDVKEQRHEILANKGWLEEFSKKPVSTFAYPFGQKEHYTQETIEIVREAGFVCACANFPGVFTAPTSAFEIPRLQVHDWSGDDFERVLDACLQ